MQIFRTSAHYLENFITIVVVRTYVHVPTLIFNKKVLFFLITMEAIILILFTIHRYLLPQLHHKI